MTSPSKIGIAQLTSAMPDLGLTAITSGSIGHLLDYMRDGLATPSDDGPRATSPKVGDHLFDHHWRLRFQATYGALLRPDFGR